MQSSSSSLQMSTNLTDRLKLAKSRHRLATTLAEKQPNGAAAATTSTTVGESSKDFLGTTTASTEKGPPLSVYERRIKQAAQLSVGSPSPAMMRTTTPTNTRKTLAVVEPTVVAVPAAAVASTLNSATWTGGSPPQQTQTHHRWSHRNLHSTLGSPQQPPSTVSNEAAEPTDAAVPSSSSFNAAKATGSYNSKYTSNKLKQPLLTSAPSVKASSSGAVVGRWRNMHELVSPNMHSTTSTTGNAASTEATMTTTTGSNDEAALVSSHPLRSSLLKNRRHDVYSPNVSSKSSDNVRLAPAAQISAPALEPIPDHKTLEAPSATLTSQLKKQPYAVSPRFVAMTAAAKSSYQEHDLIPPVQSFDSTANSSVASVNSLPLTTANTLSSVSPSRPVYNAGEGFAGLSQSKSFGGLSTTKPSRFHHSGAGTTSFRDGAKSPPPMVTKSVSLDQTATAGTASSPVVAPWKLRSNGSCISGSTGSNVRLETTDHTSVEQRAWTTSTKATTTHEEPLPNRFEKSAPPPPNSESSRITARVVSPSTKLDENETSEIRTSSSFVSDMKARFGGSKPNTPPILSAPRYPGGYLPKTTGAATAVGRQPDKLGSTPTPVGQRAFTAGADKSPSRHKFVSNNSSNVTIPLLVVASPGRQGKNTALIEESDAPATTDSPTEIVASDAVVLSHAETTKKWGSDSSSRVSNIARVAYLSPVETNSHNPIFARTHPSAVSRNRVASLQHDLGQRKEIVHPTVNKVPVSSQTFRSTATTETPPCDENVPNTENDDFDPAEESGIGEKSIWVSPRSSRLRSIDKNRPSPIVPTSRSNNATTPNRLPKGVNPSVTKTPERAATPPKAMKQWQSPRSARLKSMSTPTMDDPTVLSEDEPNRQAGEVVSKPVESRHIETRAKNSVSDMKTKLWGCGNDEKLIVVPKPASRFQPVGSSYEDQSDAKIAEHGSSVERSFASPTLDSVHEGAQVNEDETDAISTPTPQRVIPSPLKSTSSNFRSPVHSKPSRGPPDVATPHGLEPPQRSTERSSHKVEDDLVERIVPSQRQEAPTWASRMRSVADGLHFSLPRTPPRDKEVHNVGGDVNKVVVEQKHDGVLDENPTASLVPAETEVPIQMKKDQLEVLMDFPSGEKVSAPASTARTSAPLASKPARPSMPSLPPRSTSHVAREIVDRLPSQGSLDAPSADLNSLLRCPSVGDFQVGASPAPSTVENVEKPEEGQIFSSDRSSEPLSNMPDDLLVSSAHTVPPRQAHPTKAPPSSPATLSRRLAAGFSETIDGPPFETTELVWSDDNDITGPKEAQATEIRTTDIPEPPLSPRPKQERPWNRDVNTLSPSSWQKRVIPPLNDLSSTRFQQLERKVEADSSAGEEKKSSDDYIMQAPSPSSLMRMAADSIHAIDYDAAVLGLTKVTLSEDDESLLSSGAFGSAIPAVVPPEFDTAIALEKIDVKPASAVFGDPRSFGAAGGEVADLPLRVFERAKAIASWNGGLGVSPSKGDGSDPLKDAAIYALSPIRYQRSDTEGEDMSPRVASRGFALDDWHRDNDHGTGSEFEPSSDFWNTTNLNDDKDWAKCNPAFDGVVDEGNDATHAFFAAPKSHVALGKPKVDSAPRTMKFWRKQPRESLDQASQKSNTPTVESDPFFATHSAAGFISGPLKSAAFDPFADNFDFTEATEFTEGTDFFGGDNITEAADPFALDPVAFEILEKFAPKTSEEDFMHQNSEVLSSQRTLPGLAPPSGSGAHYDVWSYDADTSNHLHEGAAEI